MTDISGIVHREPDYRWAVIINETLDEYHPAEYLLVKGDGFTFTSIARTDCKEQAEEMATALNYWETRPL